MRADVSPHSAAVWYDVDGDGRILLSMGRSRLPLRFLRRDPRVSLTILDAASCYRHVILVGRVSEQHPDRGHRA